MEGWMDRNNTTRESKFESEMLEDVGSTPYTVLHRYECVLLSCDSDCGEQ